MINTSPNRIEKMIQLPHKVCDYACPTVGLEDMYEAHTGVRLPDYVIMDLSMIGFMYIRQKNAPAQRMVFWGNGTGKPQHHFLEDVIGYRWEFNEGGAFEPALARVKAHIDAGRPVILGLLDMYHLPYYEKIYHRFHVPQHYVLMVGYDPGGEVIYVQDNGIPEVTALPLVDLRGAWNVNNPGQGKKNTYAVLTLDPQPAGLETILRRGLKKRAAWMFAPPVGFMGLSGMRRLAKDFSAWGSELNPQALKASLEHLTMFTCSVVPTLPERLTGYPDKNKDPHQAVRDRFAGMLQRYGEEFKEPAWRQAADILRTSGEEIGQLTESAVDALLGDHQALKAAGEHIQKIAVLEEEAFGLLR